MQVGYRKRRLKLRLIILFFQGIDHRPAGFLKAFRVHQFPQAMKSIADVWQFCFLAVVPQLVMGEHHGFILHPAIHVRANEAVAADQPVPPQIMPPGSGRAHKQGIPIEFHVVLHKSRLSSRSS